VRQHQLLIRVVLLALIATTVGYLSGQWLFSRDVAEAVQSAPVSVARPRRPDLGLPDLEGKIRQLSDWDGQLVFVNFWASWCPPCRAEIPDFIELQRKYADQGLQFIGIAIDSLEEVKNYMLEVPINYPVLVGEEAGSAAAEAFGNRDGALPYTAVVNRQGEVVFVRKGLLKRAEAEALIKAWIKR